MARRFVVSSVLFLSITTPYLLADTIRCVFPQIAVGNTIVTVIDLTNQGTTTVQGYLELLDSNSNQLSLQVNGVTVTGLYDFEIPPRATRRFRLTRQGTEIPGHAIAWETSSAEDVFKVSYTNQIHGTAVFQVLSGGQLVDSIGVPGGSNAFLGEGVREHFFFIGEYTTIVNTGLAISNPFPNLAEITVRARNSGGSFVDGTTLELDSGEHRALFINEILNVPTNFHGTIEVVASTPVFALVLRLEEGQLSSVAVTPAIATYDFTISLSDLRTFSGELMLNIANGVGSGMIRFTDPVADVDFDGTPIAGVAAGGAFILTTTTSFNSNLGLTVFLSASVSTSSDSITASVAWEDSFGAVAGTLIGTRK